MGSNARRTAGSPAIAFAGAVVLSCMVAAADPNESSERWLDPDSPDAPPPTATATVDGLLLELWLDRTSIEPGDRLSALARISNVGTDAPSRGANPCGVGPVPTTIRLTQPNDQGREWTGNAAEFKERLLAEVWRPEVLQEPWMLDVAEAGCTAWGGDEPFGPGSIDEAIVVWDAVDQPGRPLLPGPATVSATFEGLVGAEALVEITGEPGAGPPVSDYIDSALSDEKFHAWLDAEDEPDG